MREELLKLDVIIPQNETLFNLYKKFYKIENVQLIPNFRNTKLVPKEYKSSNSLTVVFAARVCENKGIFDLLNAVSNLQKDGYDISLDIFGEMQLDKKEQESFNTYLTKTIKYCGVISSKDAIETITKYDLFCLPTKYYGEGTSLLMILQTENLVKFESKI